MRWLIDCTKLAIPPQANLSPLHAPEPVDANILVKDNGEPLVPLAGAVKLYPVYSWLGFEHMPAVPKVRAGIKERLQRASARLPPDFEVVVMDGYRTREFQAELLAYYRAQTRRELDDFVADPASPAVVPPHATGGAVDLTLGWRGAVLGLGTDFDSFLAESAPAALERDSGGSARDLRRLLASVLMAEGMAVFETEWWHWSYGDQYWAAQSGAPTAVYGEIE